MDHQYRDYYLAAFLVFIFSFLALLIDLPSLKFFHQDEVNWSRVSTYAFGTFFVEQAYTDEGWQAPFNTFGFHNPQLGKYIIGASLWLHNFRTFDGVIKWNSSEDLDWHVAQGMVPPPEALYAARLPIALLAAGTAVLLFAFGSLLTLAYPRSLSMGMGVVTAVLFLLHPAAWRLGHQAMLDIPALFFTTFAVLCTLLAARYLVQDTAVKGVLWSLGASLMTGFSLATKLNALLIWAIIFACYLGLAAYFYYKKNFSRIFLILFLLGAHLLIPTAVFVATNPFLYQDTFAGVQQMLAFNRMVLTRPGHLATLAEKANAFVDTAIGAIEPISQTKLVDNILLIAGSLLLPFALYRKKSDHPFVVTSLVVLFWAVALGIGLLIWSPRPWGRYYLPWVPASAVVEAFAILWLPLFLYDSWKKPRA